MSSICRVAYALNPKKMRKSDADHSATKDGIWHGGGLADILQVDAGDGVQFIPFDFDKDVHEQVLLSYNYDA